MTYLRTFSHIGFSITDLEKAVEFYTKVFSQHVIMPANEIVSDETAIAAGTDKNVTKPMRIGYIG